MSAVAGTDEEEQLTIPLLQSHIDDLENKLGKLQDKTDHTNDDLQQQQESNAANNQILQKDIRDLKDKMQRELDETKAEFHSDIAGLKQQLLNLASNTTSSSLTAALSNNISPSVHPSPRVPSFFFQRNDASHNRLPLDTYSMMMTSPFHSQAWLLGIFTFAFQMVLVAMIITNQLKQSQNSSDFNVPFKVDPAVRAGQFFAIIFALATQNDITTAVRFLVMFWNDPHWDRTVLGREEGAPPPTKAEWLVHIILPNIIKFVQGFIVMFITFVVIVQSDNIIDLLKDFTALMVLSDTDNIFFNLAANGYIGSKLQMKTIQAQGIKIQTEASSSDSDSNRGVNQTTASSHPIQQKDFIIRPTILFVIALIMIVGWLYIVFNQGNGKYFHQRYPKCNETANAFELATEYFGDGVCYGGPLNTLGCEFEGGDCVNFNQAYPLCKGDDRTDIQNRVGDGTCDKVFMSSDCNYDGGDCCPYHIMDDPSFGDGQCNGGKSNTEGCGFDDGDCDEFRHSYPDCPFDTLSEIEGADNIKIGDGICDSGIYNLEVCGYEFNDCNYGQVGSTVSITDDIESNGDLFFRKALSLEGTTMAFGLFATNADGRFGSTDARGLVKIWRYNSIRKMWLQMGNDIVGQQKRDNIGYRMSFSANGNRLMVSSLSGVRFYDFNFTKDEWIQVGQTIKSSLVYSIRIMTADGLKVALLFSGDEIRIYDVAESSDYDVIEPGVDLSSDEIDYPVSDVHLIFNTGDGSRLLLSAGSSDVTKVYRFHPGNDNTPKSWTQIGQDITNLSSSASSCAISADGNRIAVSSEATSTTAPGQVNLFDYEVTNNAWNPVGDPIKSSLLHNGDGFVHDIKMSSDGNLLVITVNNAECNTFAWADIFQHEQRPEAIHIEVNAFSISGCTRGYIEVYNFHPHSNQFQKVPANPASPFKTNGNILNLANLVSRNMIFGLHSSMNANGSVLSTSGYNLDDRSAFVEAYNLNELFSTKCIVDEPYRIGNGVCNDLPPFNMEACGIDGGDCKRNPFNEENPKCLVHYKEWIGNGICDDWPPYNTEACGYDGGDCKRNPFNEENPKCLVHYKEWIGNGICDDWPPYNTEACGYDSGDCKFYKYPECTAQNIESIGNGFCDDDYNTMECGFDGGDCL